MDTSSRDLSLPVSMLAWALGTGALAPAQDRSLHFNWPVPSDVEVTETIVSRQNQVVRYRVELRRGEDDGELVVRRRDYQILKIEGLDMTQYRQLLAPREARQGMLPDLCIDRYGQVLDTESWESFSKRLTRPVEDLLASGGLEPEHAANMVKALQSPETRSSIYARATEFWTLWVSGWLNNDFSGSDVLVKVTGFPLPNGDVVRGPQTLRHHGAEKGNERYVRLSAEMSVTGSDLRQRIIAMTKQQEPPAPGEPAPIPPEEITEVEAGNESWVIVRPDTMQPLEAQTENHMMIKSKDDAREVVERRHYQFDWK